jgi:hypothetical protein
MIGPVILPELEWNPTQAKRSRNGEKVVRVVVHRWGVRYTTEKEEAASYLGVVRFFENPANDASAHVVFPGSADKGKATQMVSWNEAAWAESAYNNSSDDIESADAIWLGHDPRGFEELARIVAMRCNVRKIPPVWSISNGFCRHADLGIAGGGHLECPTTNLALWHKFVNAVHYEFHRGGFRPVWGK